MHATQLPQSRLDQRFAIIIVIAIAVVVLVITWVGISKSRNDSYELLVRQGAAFTTALAEASQNAIDAERYYDRLVQRRYADLTLTILNDVRLQTQAGLTGFATTHELHGIWLYSRDSGGVLQPIAAYSRSALPAFVRSEAETLSVTASSQFVQLLDEQATGEVSLYYLQLNDRQDRLAIIASDARAYQAALRQTGIGYLSQRMAREEGVEYILYQSTEGIIFASRKPGPLLAIESDPFLQQALTVDTTSSRIYEFQGNKVLELVHPFSTLEYPQGLFRVGLSLTRYTEVSRGFDRQMIILSAALFGLVIAVVLYLNSRRKRHEISREFSHIKSLTDRIFEQMQTGVAVIDQAGNVQFANHAFEAAVGVRELVGRKWSDTISSGDLDMGRLTDTASESGEREVTLTVAGHQRTLLVAWSRLTFADSGATALVLVAYDISRIKQYEQESSRRERLSEMGNMAAGVAHEIRNPLNTISIAAQRLAGEFTPNDRADEYQRFTQSIRAETKRLNDIITRFLALTREEKKRRQRLDLKSLIEECMALPLAEAERDGSSILMNLAEGLEVEADKDALKQVFANLLNNAREAVASRRVLRIEIAAFGDKENATIRFADNGQGIPAELREKVFTPYFTTKETGTGLGLPTVYRIITEHGGTVRILDSTASGTTIQLTLPLFS
ncbi:MAG: ATP-binding protein [candidate division Zixibacteria bacterium]|nr:ATP-binding protein [candidate division Zixibacteria bacterium]